MKLGASYFGNRIVRYVAQDMKSMVDHHCNYVIHTFSENDFHFYRGTMKEIVKVSHDAGLGVYIDPWGVGKVFGGEAFSDFVMNNPQALQVLSDGKPVGVACLNHPDFRAFMTDWIDAAVETGADCLFWDEPHFYLPSWMGGRQNTWGCLCAVCQQKFEAKFKKQFPKEETEEVVAFKEASIRDFLEEMVVYTHTLGKKNALCLLPMEDAAHALVHWETFASISGLNVFGTDPYWYGRKKEVREFVGHFSRKVAQLCKGTKLEGQIWIQGFKVPAGREEELRTAIDIAVEAGIRNLALWSFEGCAPMSYIRSDNPEKVWEIIGECFGKIKDLK